MNEHACCKIDEIYHITESAHKTICGLDWKYTPNQEPFKREQKIQRLHFLMTREVNCSNCLDKIKEI